MPTATSDGEASSPANPDALPERESVREQVFNRKINAAADAYLAEQRGDAVIRRP